MDGSGAIVFSGTQSSVGAGFRRATFVVLFAVIGCAPPVYSRYVTVAEGFTVTEETMVPRIAPRLFSAPDMATICAALPGIERLQPVPWEVRIRVGERFSLETIPVIARDIRGAAAAAVPVVYEMGERKASPAVLRSHGESPQEIELVSVTAGDVPLRIRTACGPTHVATVWVRIR